MKFDIKKIYIFIYREKEMRKRGIAVENTRIVSEYKVIREIILVLCEPPDPPGTFIIETTNHEFKAASRTSISSLSPVMYLKK